MSGNQHLTSEPGPGFMPAQFLGETTCPFLWLAPKPRKVYVGSVHSPGSYPSPITTLAPVLRGPKEKLYPDPTVPERTSKKLSPGPHNSVQARPPMRVWIQWQREWSTTSCVTSWFHYNCRLE